MRMPRWLTVFIVITFVAVLLPAVGMLALRIDRSLEFRPETWHESPRLRPRMLGDFLRKHELQGMTRRDVTSLLGHPKGQDSVRNGNYIYWVESSGIDDKWLEVRFHNDQVVDIRIYPD